MYSFAVAAREAARVEIASAAKDAEDAMVAAREAARVEIYKL